MFLNYLRELDHNSNFFMDQTKLVMLLAVCKPNRNFTFSHSQSITSILRLKNLYFYSEFIFLPNCLGILRLT